MNLHKLRQFKKNKISILMFINLKIYKKYKLIIKKIRFRKINKNKNYNNHLK